MYFDKQASVFLEKYFKELPKTKPQTSNWDNFNLKDFLGKMEFEIISEVQTITKLLFLHL